MPLKHSIFGAVSGRNQMQIRHLVIHLQRSFNKFILVRCDEDKIQPFVNWTEPGTGNRGGRLTSLGASLVRCFAFYKTSSKTSGATFFKNIVQNIASLSKKCDVFTQCFRFQKAHPQTESMTNSLLIIKPRRPHI